MARATNRGGSKAFTVIIPCETYEDLRAMAPDGMSFRQYAQQIIKEQIADSPVAQARAERTFAHLQALIAQTQKAPIEDDPISA